MRDVDHLRPTGDHAIVIVVSRGSWNVQFHQGFATWADSLEQRDSEALLAALRVLRDEGPALGRPLVDSVGVEATQQHERVTAGIHRPHRN